MLGSDGAAGPQKWKPFLHETLEVGVPCDTSKLLNGCPMVGTSFRRIT